MMIYKYVRHELVNLLNSDLKKNSRWQNKFQHRNENYKLMFKGSPYNIRKKLVANL